MENEATEQENSLTLKESATEEKQRKYLTASDVRNHLRLVWKNEEGVLREVFGALNVNVEDVTDSCPTDIFFLAAMPVVPSRFRPVSTCVVCVWRPL